MMEDINWWHAIPGAILFIAGFLALCGLVIMVLATFLPENLEKRFNKWFYRL